MKNFLKYSILFLTSLIIICGLVVCWPILFPRAPQDFVRTTWIDEWLHHPTCQPPCLDNVTPGSTNKDEVVEKLMKHPGIKRVERYSGSTFDDHFYLYVTECKDSDIGSVRFDKRSNIVEDIYLYNHRCKTELSLEDFITSFGKPDYVYAYRITGWVPACRAELFYVDKGVRLRISSDVGLFIRRMNISSDSMIDRVTLFQPQHSLEQTIDYQKEINEPLHLEMDQMVPWNGFEKYDCLGSESY